MSVYSSQIIKTLAEQVQNLLPVRHSYQQLQVYHAKLIQDMKEAVTFANMSEAETASKLQYLQGLSRQLEQQAILCAQECKRVQGQYSKQVMQANQRVVNYEASQNKLQLELTQEQALTNQTQIIAQTNQSIYLNITKHKDMIHQLQLSIKSKQYENLQIQRQIKKMQLINSKIQKYNLESENNTSKVQSQNETLKEQINDLQSKIETYDKLINTKQKMNKQSLELLIKKTKELQELKHKSNYMNKLVQTQQSDVIALSRNCYELQSFLKMKRQKIMAVKEENLQYQASIAEENRRRQQNKKELGQLTHRLKTFVQTNQTLYKALQKSCAEDREVQIKLSQKLEKLFVAEQKITNNEILHHYDLNSLSKYQVLVDFQKSRGRSKGIPTQRPKTFENESTGQGFFKQVKN